MAITNVVVLTQATKKLNVTIMAITNVVERTQATKKKDFEEELDRQRQKATKKITALSSLRNYF